MARIRTIKPEFWTDSKTGTLSEFAKCLFIGLLNHADDYGVLKYEPEEWRVRIFPYHSDTTTVVLRESFENEIFKKGLVATFCCPDNIKLVFIKNFNSHQVINKKSASFLADWKIGDTPSTYGKRLDIDVTSNWYNDYGSATVVLPVGKEGKGGEGNGTTTPPQNPPKGVIYSENFQAFWNCYPRKVGKGNAKKSWDKIKSPKPTIEEILESVEQHKQGRDWAKDDGDFIPHPSTWLNQRRWDDEVTPAEIVDSELARLNALREEIKNADGEKDINY